MKYKKKPKIVEANQFHGGNDTPGVHKDEHGRPFVITIHLQKTDIAIGDYIIQEPDGIHYYPCKAEIFEKEHDPIN